MHDFWERDFWFDLRDPDYEIKNQYLYWAFGDVSVTIEEPSDGFSFDIICIWRELYSRNQLPSEGNEIARWYEFSEDLDN